MSDATMITPHAPIRVLDARVVRGAGGGPDKTILRTPQYLDPRCIEMTAAYLHPRGDAGAEVIRNAAIRFKCPLRLVPERGPLDLKAARAMLDICRELDINLWHGHDYKTDLLGLWLRRRHPMRLVTTAHGWGTPTWRTRLYYALDRRLFKRYDHVIAVSSELRDECIRHGVAPERISVVSNAIDCDEYRRRQPKDAARAALGMMPDELAMGYVGRLSAEKRVDAAIALLARLAPTHPRLTLHIVGSGPELDTLEELTRYLRVQDRVFFHGWATNTLSYFEALDLFILPSRREGTPNAVLEAMAMEVPVAATGVGAVPEVLENGRCGLVLDPEDAESWDAPVAELLDSVAQRAQLVRAARQRVESSYNFTARTATISAIYHRLFDIEPPQPLRLRRAA